MARKQSLTCVITEPLGDRENDFKITISKKDVRVEQGDCGGIKGKRFGRDTVEMIKLHTYLIEQLGEARARQCLHRILSQFVIDLANTSSVTRGILAGCDGTRR